MPKKKLKLRAPCRVYIDWANVYGWTKSLRKEIDPQKLFKYLKCYKEVQDIKFYFGKDNHLKSKQFLKEIKKIGYDLTTKPVKHIPIAKVENQVIYRRKCDFDMEICIDVHKALNKNIESFIFFTGDGDFEPLYKLLIKKRKQVIVVYMYGHLGREIYAIRKGIYKISIRALGRSSDNGLIGSISKSKKMTPLSRGVIINNIS